MLYQIDDSTNKYALHFWQKRFGIKINKSNKIEDRIEFIKCQYYY